MMNSLVNFSHVTYTTLAFGIVDHHAVADRVHQVRLAQTHAAVEEKRVVGACRGAGDRLRGGVREPVGVADDELLKRIANVEIGAAQILGRPRGRGHLHGGRRLARLGDRELQLELGAEDLAQDLDDLPLELGADPLPREFAVDREVEFVLAVLHEPHRLDPHLKNGLRKVLLQRI